MTMSQRIAVLRDGKLQQFASPRNIYARPGNEFVAGFIGTPSMNFLDGRLEGTGADRTFQCGDWSLPIGVLPLAEEYPEPDRRVRLGIRPEHVRLDSRGEAARVILVEPTGHETILVFDYRGNEMVARMEGEVSLQPDDTVNLSFRVEKLHVFAAANGARLNDDSVA